MSKELRVPGTFLLFLPSPAHPTQPRAEAAVTQLVSRRDGAAIGKGFSEHAQPSWPLSGVAKEEGKLVAPEAVLVPGALGGARS